MFERLDMSRKTLARRHRRSLEELHPELLARVRAVLADLGGRFKAWEGYRGREEQLKALQAGNSRARPGESPHNFKPALACDLVLNPDLVRVAPHPADPRYPNLWDSVSPEAVSAWAGLEAAAVRHHLARVNLGRRRDLPHVELPDWREIAKNINRGKRVK